MAIQDFIFDLTLKLFYFFIPEVLIWIIGSRIGHSWVVAFFALVIYIFSEDVMEMLVGNTFHNWILMLGTRMLGLTAVLIGFNTLWVYTYFFDKGWDSTAWIILFACCIAGAALFLIPINLGVLSAKILP